MSTYTRRRHSPQGQYNIAGKGNDNIYSQAQHAAVPGRRADGVDWPFPNKPVSHRRPPRKQDSLDLHGFEKITITKQSGGPLSPQEHHSNGITRSRDTRKDPHRLPSGEVQMAKAIHAKELMLQEKLWSVEEKIRQKIQRDADAGEDQWREEQRHGRGQNTQTKTRLSEQQRREPVRSREMMMQERRQEDVKQFRKREDQRNEDRMRDTHEERARWKRRDTEDSPSSQSHKIHQITVHKQEVSGEHNRSRWENVKEHTRRRKGGDEKDNGIWRETGVKPEDGTSMGDKGWTRERKYRERTCKEVYGLDDERDMPEISQQKMFHKVAIENHRDAERTLSGGPGPGLPPVSSPSHSSRPPEQADPGQQLLPCRICNRKFASERLQKHVEICEKVKKSHRQVFNTYVNRTKGTTTEEFFKTHSRSKTPEVLKKSNRRQNHKTNTRNPHEGRLPAGTSKPNWSK